MNEVYFTVKEIAEIIGYSKPTVQSIINKKDIKPDNIVNNKYRYYSSSKTIEIIKEIKGSFDFGDLSPNNEKLQEKVAKWHESIEKQKGGNEKYNQKSEKQPENNGKRQNDPDIMSRMLDILQQELEKKDQQIMDLQDKLSAAYVEIGDLARQAQELAGQAHYITAMSAASTEVRSSDQEAAAATLEPDLEVSEGVTGPDPPQSWLRRILDKLLKDNGP